MFLRQFQASLNKKNMKNNMFWIIFSLIIILIILMKLFSKLVLGRKMVTKEVKDVYQK